MRAIGGGEDEKGAAEARRAARELLPQRKIGRGLSFWLVPDGTARSALRTEIARLAAAHGTTPFEPHVTLLPGVERSEAEVVSVGFRLAREIPPIRLSVRGTAHSREFFRCVYLEIETADALVRANEKAREIVVPGRPQSFHPHVSLVYGELDAPTRRALAGDLDPLAPRNFSVSTLEVVRTEGPAESWRTVAVFPLSGASSRG